MELRDFFQECPKVALGFSGGVDSAYLLYAALDHGAQVRPYFIKTAFQPQFELEDARRLCAQLGVELTVLELDVLQIPGVVENPPDRCYHCKRALFGRLRQQARADGYTVLIDGTNASDDAGDRPGMRALGELSVVQSAVLRHRFTQQHTRQQTAQALHITPQEVRREEARALQLLRGKPAVLALRTDFLEGAAYHGTGWFSWYYEQGSVEERLVECKRSWTH